MIEDQSENGLPGVTLSEPSLKHSTDLDGTSRMDLLDISKCMVRTNDPHHRKLIPGGVSIVVADDAVKLLERLATAQSITPTEALRKAIATESYLHGEIEKGSKVLLLTPDKEIREVVFR